MKVQCISCMVATTVTFLAVASPASVSAFTCTSSSRSALFGLKRRQTTTHRHNAATTPSSSLNQARRDTDLNMVQSTSTPNETTTTPSSIDSIDVDTVVTTEIETGNPFMDGLMAKLQSVSGGGSSEYTAGFAIIGFITFLNASTNPLWHAAFAGNGPPPLLLNAAVSVVALAGLLIGGPLLDRSVGTVKDLAVSTSTSEPEDFNWQYLFGGMELGFWKFLGTTSHLYGLSLTTANHGAFLIQLTTLIVPVIQGLQGEKIPRQIQAAVGLALLGVFAFTQDPSGAAEGAVAVQQQSMGDLLCIACAFFYSAYDIQTFKWGKIVPRTQLVTTKIGTQALLSVSLCAGIAWTDCGDYFASNPDLTGTLIPVVLWSGLMVNALATFLQVGGMQAIGPTRAQTIFASQPLWSSILAYAFLGETIGVQGALGASAFLFALYLAITAPREEEPAASNASETLHL
jgi:drug/metabolite transporter (DMT)-like permease